MEKDAVLAAEPLPPPGCTEGPHSPSGGLQAAPPLCSRVWLPSGMNPRSPDLEASLPPPAPAPGPHSGGTQPSNQELRGGMQTDRLRSPLLTVKGAVKGEPSADPVGLSRKVKRVQLVGPGCTCPPSLLPQCSAPPALHGAALTAPQPPGGFPT